MRPLPRFENEGLVKNERRGSDLFFSISCLLSGRKPPHYYRNTAITMKQLFALFCAIILMPSFSAHAWIGGPFSNNSHFGTKGDDGVYEVVGTAVNGLGLYRIIVGNNFGGVNPSGVQASVPAQAPNPGGGGSITVPGINSGNIFFGGLGSNQSNIWFFEGVAYFGNAIGTVNSAQGIAVAVGSATSPAPVATLNSFFNARISRQGKSVVVSGFTGVGELRVSTALNNAVPFTVFGTKVSDDILFGL